eukprot:765910-Hanusia_phi.AAC.3
MRRILTKPEQEPASSRRSESEKPTSLYQTRRRVVAEIAKLGVQAEHTGTHSIHTYGTGSATYCSSSSTNSPSAAAICERAGWSNGKVFEKAGDSHVGRTAAGLQVDDTNFALLPAHSGGK